jgi:hypothetical protein
MWPVVGASARYHHKQIRETMNVVSTTSASSNALAHRDDSSNGSGSRVITFSFVMLLAIAVPIEIVCAVLLYATRGDIVSGAVGMSVLLNIGAILLYTFRWRIAAITLAGALALSIVAFAVRDGYELLRVQEEAARTVSYVYETRISTSELPADLKGYRWQSADLARDIHYTRESADAFTVVYSVPGSHSNYWYSSSDGWHYYPD